MCVRVCVIVNLIKQIRQLISVFLIFIQSSLFHNLFDPGLNEIMKRAVMSASV